MRHIAFASFLLAFALLAAAPALADEVVLRDGQVLVGRPTIEGQTLTLSLPSGEVRTIPLSRVAKIRHEPGFVPGRGMTVDGGAVPPPPVPSGPGAVERRGLVPPMPVAQAPCPAPCPAPQPAPCPPDPCDDPCQDACKWTGPWSLSVGLNWTQAGGNSDSVAFKGDFDVAYDRAPWKWVTKGFYAYAESGGSVDTNRVFVDTKVDRKFRGCWYAFFKGSYDWNEPADLDYRVIGTLGVGNTFVKREDMELNAEVGGGATWEKRAGLASRTDPSAYLGVDFWKEFRRAGKILFDYDFLPNLNDFDLSIMRFDLRYELPLSACLSLRLGFRVDYQIEPEDPTVDEIDWIWSAGLAVSF